MGKDIETRAFEKLVKLASDRGLKLELEFEGQEFSFGDSKVEINGKTTVETGKKEDEG